MTLHARRRNAALTGCAALAVASLAACAAPEATADSGWAPPAPVAIDASTGQPDIWNGPFATASMPYAATVSSDSDGDLWPAAWADDGALYSANGDGKGFDLAGEWQDLAVNRIDGTPETGLTGKRLAVSEKVAPVWSDPVDYNRKPTGMVAVDSDGNGKDELYLAVQDLRYGTDSFDDAPAASISRSDDYGATWTPTDQAMFSSHVFTTVMFLDFGQSNRLSEVLGDEDAGYVYAYGLDGNWRDSFSGRVADPTDLYLARVPVDAIQDRSAWRFFAGMSKAGKPAWDKDIAQRAAVLHDDRRVYPDLEGEGVKDLSVLSQGSIVYNAGLKLYVYTSWTEYTFEFYTSPQPWGPWTLTTRKDFGPYPWFGEGSSDGWKNGGYGAVIPSKFISNDGRRMWVQSNWFVGNSGDGANTYRFSLRPFDVTPASSGVAATNDPDPDRNLSREPGAVVLDRTSHYGHSAAINDGDRATSEDSWNGVAKTTDFWGIAWPTAYRFNQITYIPGDQFPNGGWYAAAPEVQVRTDDGWQPVQGVTTTPSTYPGEGTEAGSPIVFSFPAVEGTAVRIVGTPGGAPAFTSIAELEVRLT